MAPKANAHSGCELSSDEDGSSNTVLAKDKGGILVKAKGSSRRRLCEGEWWFREHSPECGPRENISEFIQVASSVHIF